jgi:type I restriction enzyme S subunit
LDFVTPSDIRNGMREISRPVRQVSGAGRAAFAKNIIPAGSILVTCIGADMGKTVINANDCVTNQQINAIIFDGKASKNYLFHVLTAQRDVLRRQGEASGSTLPMINKTDFSKIEVDLPSLRDQQRIESILDKFDALLNDLNVGLPAELNARRKQYEHYRDRLLSFEKAAI